MKTIASDPQAFARLGELIQDINVAMITTVGLDGALHSRPMFTRRLENDENLWFFTSEDSLKAHEVSDEHQVNVTYSEPKHQRYVSVSGTATIVRERPLMHRLWHPMVRSYFPQGLDDPKLALLRVRIESAEYWEVAANQMAKLYAQARSIATGDALRPMGEHRHVDLPTFAGKK